MASVIKVENVSGSNVIFEDHDHQANPKVNIRHCAYCLISVPNDKIQLCGQCRRRAYCSRECQKADWSPKGKGQGHKIWCPLECGEEDLDWEVAPVHGKGLGLIAKRPLPSKFRIMVEACRTQDHPGINDLMPKGGTTEEKLELNCLGFDPRNDKQDKDDDFYVLCLRMARANHSCDPNAGHIYDEKLKVKILFAERDIAEGGEICIRYQTLFGSREKFRATLKKKWGIVCPDNCFCRNETIKKLMDETHSSLLKIIAEGDGKKRLAFTNKLMDFHEKAHSSWLEKMQTLCYGHELAITRQSGIRLGKLYAKQLYEIASSIYSPEDDQVRKYAEWLNNPQTHQNFLILESQPIFKLTKK